jgi:hypothetical protein
MVADKEHASLGNSFCSAHFRSKLAHEPGSELVCDRGDDGIATLRQPIVPVPHGGRTPAAKSTNAGKR